MRQCRRWRYGGVVLTAAFVTFVCVQFLVSEDRMVLVSLSDNSAREGRKLFQKQDASGDGTKNQDSLSPSDRKLVNHVKSLIKRPTMLEYNLTRPHDVDFSRGQSARIDDFLHAKVNSARKTRHFDFLNSEFKLVHSLFP